MLCKCEFNRPEHRANGGPLKLNFRGIRMQRWNKSTDKAQRVDEKRCVYLFSYHVYFQINSYQNVK